MPRPVHRTEGHAQLPVAREVIHLPEAIAAGHYCWRRRRAFRNLPMNTCLQATPHGTRHSLYFLYETTRYCQHTRGPTACPAGQAVAIPAVLQICSKQLPHLAQIPHDPPARKTPVQRQNPGPPGACGIRCSYSALPATRWLNPGALASWYYCTDIFILRDSAGQGTFCSQ